jgi:hypothetical protein
MKPIVHFRYFSDFPEVGRGALLYPRDHPDHGRVSNKRLVHTSKVLSVSDDGKRIETENTIYILEEEEQ